MDPGPPPPPRPLVVPAPGSRLEQLLGMLDAAEAAAADAATALKDVKDGIKLESAAAAAALLPDGTPLPGVIDIAGDAARPPLVQRWKVKRQLNRAKLDADYPGLWDSYAEYGQGYWELRAK